MNTKAIEAGAVAVYNHDQPNHQAWPFDVIDKHAQDGLRLRAQLVIEAARPHLETEIRAQIAAEIRAERMSPDLDAISLAAFNQAPLEVVAGWGHGKEQAAHIAEGKP